MNTWPYQTAYNLEKFDNTKSRPVKKKNRKFSPFTNAEREIKLTKSLKETEKLNKKLLEENTKLKCKIKQLRKDLSDTDTYLSQPIWG